MHRVGHGTHEVFIEFTLSGTYGGKPIAWDAVDRFTFTNGLIAERVSYFDSAPLMVKLVGRPAGWERLVRIGSQLLQALAACRGRTTTCAGRGYPPSRRPPGRSG